MTLISPFKVRATSMVAGFYMKFGAFIAIVLTFGVVLSTVLVSPSFAQTASDRVNYEHQFDVLGHKLYLSITPSLYSYYANLSHQLNNDGYYARLDTPVTVASIAENLRNITANLPNEDEQFANAVLTFVHQIPYNITGPKYPVETLVKDSGDCTGLSLLAASIMKAGGLDVVIIHYLGIDPGHMNLGVYLPYTPAYHSLLIPPTDFEYDNRTYWTAEATGKLDWRVGDQPDSIGGTGVIITSLNNTDNNGLGHVASRLDHALLASSINLTVSEQPPVYQKNTRALVVSGSTSTAVANDNVTIRIYGDHAFDSLFSTVMDSFGNYTLIWNVTSAGTYHIAASWGGSGEFAGADSEPLTVFIGPESLVQFQTTEYNYIYARFGMASYILRPFVGVNDFLNLTVGTNVTVSYDFTILSTGHNTPAVPAQTVTTPSHEQTVRLSRSQVRTINVPERTLTVPKTSPSGMEPVRLPDDFNQTINNQFSVVLQTNPEENCSLNVRGLNDYEVSSMQSNESSDALINATGSLEPNAWYRVSSSISAKGVITTLEDSNGTLIQSQTIPNNQTNNSVVLLMANNIDSAVVFKDLQIQSLTTTPHPTETPKPKNVPSPLTGLLIICIFVAALCIAATVLHVRKKVVS